jgi:hypothetical protein
MILLPVIFKVFSSLLFTATPASQKTDTCAEAKAGAANATLLAKDSLFNKALINIKSAFALDNNEHCTSFGKDAAGNIILSAMLNGGATSGKVPTVKNAFADLHNHPGNLPPDAGDFYGLIDLNKKISGSKTRFVVTTENAIYALLVTDNEKAYDFTLNHPRQPPAFAGGPPGFTVAITDEAREMKYKYHCTDEMVLAFILEKYQTGVTLLKKSRNGVFNKIFTIAEKNGNEVIYKTGTCF